MTSFAHDSRALAETYDRVSELQFESGKALTERLGVKEGERVLDVGCGTGRLARWISERVGETGAVAGVDPLEERIRIARSGGGPLRFELGQAEALSAFEAASFDVVCMSSVLHWIGDKARALAEARRVLRTGGRLGLTTVPQELSRAGTVNQVLDAVLSRHAGSVDRSMSSRGCTTTELVTLLAGSGFALVELHVTQHARRFESGEAVVDFMEASAFGTLLRNVPDALHRGLREELVAAFDARRDSESVMLRGYGVLCIAARA